MIRTAPKSWKQWGLVGVHPSYSVRNFFRPSLLLFVRRLSSSNGKVLEKLRFEKIPTIIGSKGNFPRVDPIFFSPSEIFKSGFFDAFFLARASTPFDGKRKMLSIERKR